MPHFDDCDSINEIPGFMREGSKFLAASGGYMPLGDMRPSSKGGEFGVADAPAAITDVLSGEPVRAPPPPSTEKKSVSPGEDISRPPGAEKELRADIFERIDNSHLTDTQLKAVTTLLQKYEGAFVDEQGNVGTTSCPFHKIDTGNAQSY
jgi:hypothetical protein